MSKIVKEIVPEALLGCKGCLTQFDEDDEPIPCTMKENMRILNPATFCPCQICIVKTMCEDDCQDYRNYERTTRFRIHQMFVGAKIKVAENANR